MNLFDVYPLHDITLTNSKGCYVYDKNNQEYLDFYGGHAVISIGHGHPHYVNSIKKQLDKLAFFSNAVNIEIKNELAAKLGKASGYQDYQLFLTNSGAEANENAIKYASFHNKKNTIVALSNSFHGRTSLTIAATDIPKYRPEISKLANIIHVPIYDLNKMEDTLKNNDVCALIIEPIQGVAGINVLSKEYLQSARAITKQYDTLLICDEIQCGYGRSGYFFAHQYADISPDIITVAKGMGNGFPIGGVLIHPDIKPFYGMSGTTYGGNPLACAAAIAVLDVIENENLIKNAKQKGEECIKRLSDVGKIKNVRGMGLMIGIELEDSIKAMQRHLLYEDKIFTGSSMDPNTIRLLPPLVIDINMVQRICLAIEKYLTLE